MFTIPVIITIGEHKFEFYTLVNEATSYYLFAISIKALTELEATVDMRDQKDKILQQSSKNISNDILLVKTIQQQNSQVASNVSHPTQWKGHSEDHKMA